MSDFRFGICTSFRDKEKMLLAKKAGAEFIEANFCDLSKADDEAINDFLAFSKAENLPCLTANRMFPGELKVVGSEVDYAAIDEYLDRAGEKFSKIGGQTVVFGSSGSRRCPEGFSYEAATEQLVKLCAEHIAPYMRKHGIICAIEPLNRKECNVITTARRGFEICKSANVPEVRLLIDMYHFDTENEPLESILDYKGYIQHIHIANARNERKLPKFSDTTDYKAFLETLSKAEYTPKLISLEGRCENFFEEAREAFEVLKKL